MSDKESASRARQARDDLRKHIVHVSKIMKSAHLLSREQPHAVRELQILVGSLVNASAEFREINKRLDGSETRAAVEQKDTWKDRKYVSYRGRKGWEAATVSRYNPKDETVVIRLDDSGRRVTVGIHSGFVR